MIDAGRDAAGALPAGGRWVDLWRSVGLRRDAAAACGSAGASSCAAGASRDRCPRRSTSCRCSPAPAPSCRCSRPTSTRSRPTGGWRRGAAGRPARSAAAARVPARSQLVALLRERAVGLARGKARLEADRARQAQAQLQPPSLPRDARAAPSAVPGHPRRAKAEAVSVAPRFASAHTDRPLPTRRKEPWWSLAARPGPRSRPRRVRGARPRRTPRRSWRRTRAGRPGLRLETRPWSVTTSSSTTLPPALRMSVRMLG